MIVQSKGIVVEFETPEEVYKFADLLNEIYHTSIFSADSKKIAVQILDLMREKGLYNRTDIN